MKIWISICGWKKTASRIDMATNQQLRFGFSPQLGLALLSLLGHCQDLNAAEEESDNNGQLIPDIELLEFIGSFQTDSGEWIEPDSLLTDEFVELLDLAARMDSAQNSNNNSANEDNQQDGQ